MSRETSAHAEDTRPRIYFMRVADKEDASSLANRTSQLLTASGLAGIVRPNTLVAVKQHFGERGNEGFIRPQVAKVVADAVKARGGSPLLVESNTLYRGKRSNAYDHLMLAHEHGFTIGNTGMPVLLLDGVNGQNQRAVSIKGKHFQTVYVAPDLPFFDSIFVLSHVKGHMMSGMGGAIKNLGMGLSSRAGKLSQHADFRPSIDQRKCTRCELCGNYCPVGALGRAPDGEMQIDLELCIGCGECHVACRSDAIDFNWGRADRKFQEKMAEHALGAVAGHKGKVAYLNYLVHISKQCDCWDEPNPPLCADVGIFAGFDPVAIDRACYDVGREVLGQDIFKQMWPALSPLAQLEHGEAIGLGTQEYELSTVSAQMAATAEERG